MVESRGSWTSMFGNFTAHNHPFLAFTTDFDWDETIWLSKRFSHSPAIAQITPSSVKLSLLLSRVDLGGKDSPSTI